jgi:predicted alternative tryptophan synthase beta-subunit
MKLMGADIYASPSKETTIGKTVLTKNANHQGSLGIAVEEDLNLTTQQ